MCACEGVCGVCVHEMGIEVQTVRVGACVSERVYGGCVCAHARVCAACAHMKWAQKLRLRV